MEVPPVKYKNKCCVLGCTNRTKKRHRFPKDQDMMKKWIENIMNPHLKFLHPDEIYRSYYVCDKHFAQEYIIPGTKRGLRKDAVPTLFLSDIQEDVASIESTSIDPADTISLPLTSQTGEIISLPSTSSLPLTSTTCLPSTSQDIEIISYPSTSSLPSTSTTCTPTTSRALTPDKSIQLSTVSGTSKYKRKGILRTVNVTRAKDLTPRCHKFYKMVGQWARKTAKAQETVKNVRRRLLEAKKVADSSMFQNIINNVNNATYTFILQQLRTQQQTPRARRFTLEEKILSLTLFKSSAKGYKLLSKIFALPTPRTLSNMLNSVPFGPGINKKVFNSLELAVKKLKNPNDRVCALIFDEMSISPLLQYNAKEDVIYGLQDFGGNRMPLLADYANVFMLKGLNRQWKQALMFTFSHGPIKADKLKVLIKQAIAECLNVGLEVVCTTCDQGSSNRAAINALMRDTSLEIRGENKYEGFFIKGREVVPLFDVPHLFKGIRNNFLTKDIHFNINGINKVAKWKHIEQLYLLDKLDDVRLCPKLRDGHIFANKMNKMKVSVMSQVFSHKVGSLLKRISHWDTRGEYNLSAEAAATGELILFFDQLFDSLNGNAKVPPASKPLRGGVHLKSPHSEFWKNAISVVDSMKFYDAKKKKLVKVPSTVNLCKTLKGFMYLKQNLLKKLKYFLPRAFNQDCLENFFAALRSHGRRENVPNAAHFITSFKALVVNNFMARHSPTANCEIDSTTGALDDLRSFLLHQDSFDEQPLEQESSFNVPVHILKCKKTRVGKSTLAYLAGYIGRRAMRKKDCQVCKTQLTASDGNVPLEVIEGSQYPNSELFKPGSFLYFLVCKASAYLFYYIATI